MPRLSYSSRFDVFYAAEGFSPLNNFDIYAARLVYNPETVNSTHTVSVSYHSHYEQPQVPWAASTTWYL
jgi:hypothetical protein